MAYKAKVSDESEKENIPPATLADLAPNLEPSKLAFMQEQVCEFHFYVIRLVQSTAF